MVLSSFIVFFFAATDRNFLVMLLFSSQLVLTAAQLSKTETERQEAVIGRIEIISRVTKSAKFALEMIRLLIIRASYLVVDTLD